MRIDPDMVSNFRRSPGRKDTSTSVGRKSNSKGRSASNKKTDDIKNSKAPSIKKIKSTAGLQKENKLGDLKVKPMATKKQVDKKQTEVYIDKIDEDTQSRGMLDNIDNDGDSYYFPDEPPKKSDAPAKPKTAEKKSGLKQPTKKTDAKKVALTPNFLRQCANFGAQAKKREQREGIALFT